VQHEQIAWYIHEEACYKKLIGYVEKLVQQNKMQQYSHRRKVLVVGPASSNLN
jgi:hypothetical protein